MIVLGGRFGEDDLTGYEPQLSTGDVSLRDVTDGDLSKFFEHQMDREANRMAAFAVRDRGVFMAHWTRILGDDTITKDRAL